MTIVEDEQMALRREIECLREEVAALTKRLDGLKRA